MFSWLPYFIPKLFSFSCIRLLICFRIISPPPLVGRIFFFCCFGMFCLVCIVLLFLDIFLIFLLSPVLSGLFPQVVLLFFLVLLLSQRVPEFFLCFIILACFRSFLICVSSRISHPGFEFLFVKRTPIFSQTIFSPAWISSFNLIMFFCGYISTST